MPKGEIIQFPLKKGTEHQFETAPKQLSGNENGEETINLTENLEFSIKLSKMLEYLTALVKSSGRPSKQSIELRRSTLIEKSTLKELCDLVINSNEADWQHQPTYYHAVIAELRRRKLID